jgi:magnesium-transporting ATPase (P-type)
LELGLGLRNQWHESGSWGCRLVMVHPISYFICISIYIPIFNPIVKPISILHSNFKANPNLNPLSDVVILDDKFSSIVKAIMWGRTVYDNIRKFLQYQLTVNLVALPFVFIGAVAGEGQPLNAVMMLWINLIASCMGALALATEPPTLALLARRPYKRNAFLITWPMRRNIAVQACFQLGLLLVILFAGAPLFGVPQGEACLSFEVAKTSDMWDISTLHKTDDASLGQITCESFETFCVNGGRNSQCFETQQFYFAPGEDSTTSNGESFYFKDLYMFEDICLDNCRVFDYRHGTIIFNTFIFCQFFNEYTSRKLLDEWNVFQGLLTNPTFLLVSAFLCGAQVFLVEIGRDFMKTSPLTIAQWFITIALASFGIPLGMLMRKIPIQEDPNSFFVADGSLMNIEKEEEVEGFETVLEVQELPDTHGDCGGNKKMLIRVPSKTAQSMSKIHVPFDMIPANMDESKYNSTDKNNESKYSDSSNC